MTATPAETGTGGTSGDALRNVWSQALLEMDPITATLARAVDHVESPQPGVVRMVFRAESRMAMNRCELPEHRAEIANTLARVTGNPVTVETTTLPPVSRERPAPPRPSGRSRMQRMREIESNELVRSCLDLFAAEIVRVDLPRE